MENYLMINGVKIELTPEQLEKLSVNVSKSPKWEDFGEISGYYVSTNSVIENCDKYKARENHKNTFPTKEEAEACLALSQLCQWRDKYNEGWKADWSDDSVKYVINYIGNKIDLDTWKVKQGILAFKSREIADKFLKDFEDLIHQAKPLL